jgi:GAF domain-containing protein
VATIATTATAILDFQELLQSSVDLTKEKFDLLHAQIYLLDAAEDTLVLAAGAGEAGQRLVAEGRSIPLQQEQSLVVRAARTRQGVIFNDIKESSGWLSDSLLPEARAQMAIPMVAGDKVMGVLDVQADVTDRFTQEDIHIKTVLATQVAAALQNADLFSRMQEALKESQQSHELLRSVIDATPDWIFIKDHEHRYRLVNQGYANSLQLTPEDFIGKNDLELGFPEDIVKGNPDKGIRGFWPDDQEVMEAGEPKFIESEPAVIDDQPLFLSTIKVPLRDADENVWGVLGFVRDITERERVLEEMETLFQASAGLNTSQSYEDILSVLRQYTVVGQDAQNVSLNYFDRPFTDEQTPEWVNLLSRWSELSSETVMTRYPTATFPAITEALRPDVPILVEDVSTDPRLDDSSRALYAKRFGAHSTIFVPLVVGGQWIGYINAIYQQPTTFPEPEVRRLMVLAGQAAVAVQNLRNIALTEARAAQLEQLARLESALSRATTEEEIVEALAHNLESDRPDRLILQYLTTDEQDQPLYAETVAVWEEGAIRDDDPDLHQRYPIEQFSLSTLWLEAPDEILLISDVQSDPRIEEELREMLTRLDVAAFANLPLRSGNRWQGLIALDWSNPHTFSETEAFLYRQLLEPVAAVVAGRRAYLAQEVARSESERWARREQTIREITEKMRAATSLDQLIQTAAQELGQRFGAEYTLVELGIEDSDNKVVESQG